jgi:hypothetical protein
MDTKTLISLVRRQNAYVEIVGSVTAWSVKLTIWDRWRIGEFTRENVADWLVDYTCNHQYEDFPVDFHAVCGDVDIPWTTKECVECYTASSAGKPYIFERTSLPTLWEGKE